MRFTEKGLDALRDSQRAKRKVEAEIKAILGKDDFDRLMITLRKIGSGD